MNLTIDIPTAAEMLRKGKVVAFPTETVYGLGANALDPMAVAKIFELKERPSFDPLIVHIAEKSDLERLCDRPDPRIYPIIDAFWPGPLTIVLPKSELVPDIVTSGLSSVGIRMPNNPIALELIRAAGVPLAAPSANKFGRISPTSAQHVAKQLPEVDGILDGGSTQVGIESTIIRLTTNGFQILRNGLITREDLEPYLPFDPTPPDQMVAPGMLPSHYSPLKIMHLVTDESDLPTDYSRAGLISFSGKWDRGFAKVISLSEKRDLREYAVRLFAAMHSLEDDATIDTIYAETVPEEGIGKAIMDRLRKASHR